MQLISSLSYSRRICTMKSPKDLRRLGMSVSLSSVILARFKY